MRVAALLVALALLPAGASDRYATIDAHALNAPDSVESTPEALAAYLVGPARTDAEKARAVFRWITAHIAYDTDAFFGRAPLGDQGPAAVLARRSSVCAGFSNLFVELGRVAGLEVATIPGYAKGFGVPPDDTLAVANHDWNAVRIDGRWELIDCTWGAGHADERGVYVARFDDFYFLTPPERMLATHYPLDPAWQLVERPISKTEFARRVRVTSAFFELGLAVETHPGAVIPCGDRLTVCFRAPPGTAMTASLGWPSGGEDDGAVFTQCEDGRCCARVLFPAADTTDLYLYARPAESRDEYDWVAAYRVLASGGAEPRACFPEQYESFQARGATLEEPWEGRLRAGAAYRFTLRLPGAVEAAVIGGDDFHPLARGAGDRFDGRVVVPAGRVRVGARYPDAEAGAFEIVLEYLAE